jgi:hypothetical protein
MARLIIPEDFTSQRKLLEAVYAEHTKQLSDSMIGAYIVQNNIDLDSYLTKSLSAQVLDDTQILLVKQSTNYTQLRNLFFDPVISNLKSEVQFLKSMNKSNTKHLGEWGITVIGDSKISYPTNFVDMAKVANLFFDKHLSFTTNTSLLYAFVTKNNIDVQADKDFVMGSIDNNDKSVQASKDSENATEQRNLLWLPVMDKIRGIGGFLMKLYPNNPRALGAWGFTIADTGTKAKQVITRIKLSDKTTLKGVVIGGTLKNIGSDDVHIYKGSSTAGNPIILTPGLSIGITKGFNTVTITNPSDSTEAKITSLRSS